MTRRCDRCNYPLLTPEPKDRLCEVCRDTSPAHSTQNLRMDEPQRNAVARLTSDGVDYGHERRARLPQ